MQNRPALFVLAIVLTACTPVQTAPPATPSPQTAVKEGAQAATDSASLAPSDRRAWFGELHLHTNYSFDAWTLGTKLGPDDAYRFASGGTVMVPAYQIQREQGLKATDAVPARRAWALDFAAVTDHSEYLGAVSQIDVPSSAFSKTDLAKSLSSGDRRAFYRAAAAIRGTDPETAAAFRQAAEAADAWTAEKRAANAHYRPGTFTTFIAYEWSASPGAGVHMHRNVIFSGDDAPAPFSSIESTRPEDLWAYLDGVRDAGEDVLAIPHNSNLSDGRDFDWYMSDGKPIDAMYALQRSLNEPLIEISQNKGTSETTPDLSASDEFANFEIMDRVYAGQDEATEHGSYVREGLGRGLVVGAKAGANPFKVGFVGGTDFHNALTTSEEDAFAGGANGIDPNSMLPDGQQAKSNLDMTGLSQVVRPNGQRENDPLQYSSGAVTGVWAEENTRESIFAALRRRETFATSGTRIRVRMFGGWNFATDLMANRDWLTTAYGDGVPMGGDLSATARSGQAPAFAVQAAMDPDGARLDRIQIVKLWLDGDDYKEKVFDVALSDGRKVDPVSGKPPPVGDTVNLRDGSYTNSIGAAELTTVWRDPEFNPDTPAVYYARVLQIPTPRWSTLLAIRRGLPIPDRVAATIQERAWTSPIWYAP
ncbi:MAG: DUF3604 domain-containing protein [Hyphomonadaceae bacterium]